MQRLIEKMSRAMLVIAVAAAALAFVSCKNKKKESADNQEKVRIEKVADFRSHGLTSYELDVVVANDSRVTFKLESASVDVYIGSMRLGSIKADVEITVPKRSTTTVTLPLSASIDNPLGLISAYNKISRGDTGDVHFTLHARIKAAGAARTIERQNITLAEVLSLAGVDPSSLKNIKF